MKNKMNNLFCKISDVVLLAGLIILVIGLYYLIIKSKAGLVLAVCGGITRVVVWRVGSD